jgi:hypothetical protein
VTAYLDTLSRLVIDGIKMPYQRVRITGGQRDHVHEFPYVPGGLPELFGRKLYEFHVTLKIDDGIMRAGGIYRGRNLFTNLNVLMGRWDEGRRFAINLPNIGEIPLVYATQWERDLDVRFRSGETCEVTFREDADAAALIAKTLSLKPTATMATQLGAMDALLPVPAPSIFDQIRDAVNAVLAYRDQTQMWSDFIVAKLEGLLALFAEADTLDLFNDPLMAELLDALHALWASAQEMYDSSGELATYTTVIDTDAAGVSRVIWGDTAHAVDVINLNPISDPYRIAAGTEIRYLKAA